MLPGPCRYIVQDIHANAVVNGDVNLQPDRHRHSNCHCNGDVHVQCHIHVVRCTPAYATASFDHRRLDVCVCCVFLRALHRVLHVFGNVDGLQYGVGNKHLLRVQHVHIQPHSDWHQCVYTRVCTQTHTVARRYTQVHACTHRRA
jgi:hypothetical protein